MLQKPGGGVDRCGIQFFLGSIEWAATIDVQIWLIDNVIASQNRIDNVHGHLSEFGVLLEIIFDLIQLG